MNGWRRKFSQAGMTGSIVLVSFVLAEAQEPSSMEFRDVVPPVPLSNGFAWIAAGVLLLLGLILGMGFWLKRRRRAQPVEVRLSPRDAAWQALDALARRPLNTPEEIKAFAFDLSLTLRRFIEDQLGIRAPEMTTEEFLAALRGDRMFSEKQKKTLEEFFRLTDQIKYARLEASPSQCHESLNAVRAFIEETVPQEDSAAGQEPTAGRKP